MPNWNKNITYEYLCSCDCGEKFTTHSKKARYIVGHFRKFQVGNKAPSWQGGITKDRGYIFLYTPEHPHNNKGYVKRSRLTMEKKIGRILESQEVVHHINGIKTDDRIENLFLTTKIGHNSIHKNLPKGKWAFKYDSCKSCKKSEHPHHAHGFCFPCYAKWYIHK